MRQSRNSNLATSDPSIHRSFERLSKRHFNGRFAVAVGALVCASTTTLAATAGDLSVVGEARSDWVYHGLSENLGEPSIGVNAEWHLGDHAFTGIELHEANASSTRQRHRGLTAYAGTSIAIGELQTLATVKHHTFPGATKEWDYTEFGITLAHPSGTRLLADYAADYYAHDTRALHIAGSYQLKRHGRRGYRRATLGHLTLSSSLDHWYGQLASGRAFGRLNIELNYTWHNRAGDLRFGEVLKRPGVGISVAYLVF